MKYVYELVKNKSEKWYRISEENTDDAIGFCYLEEHADLICSALNSANQVEDLSLRVRMLEGQRLGTIKRKL